MAYTKKKLEKMCLEVIQSNEMILFVNDILVYVPIAKSTYYKHKLHESNALKEALNKNRVIIKTNLLNRWIESDSSALQLAAYRLICEVSELEKLHTSNIKIDRTKIDEHPAIDPLPIYVD